MTGVSLLCCSFVVCLSVVCVCNMFFLFVWVFLLRFGLRCISFWVELFCTGRVSSIFDSVQRCFAGGV